MSKRGQPSKYDPKYCQMLIEHMAEGFTFESFAGLLRVDRDTIYEWCNAHQDFSDAKKTGRAAQLLRDEQVLMSGTNGRIRGFIPSTHIFKMKNCHGWRDERADKKKDPNGMTDDELKEELKRILGDE